MKYAVMPAKHHEGFCLWDSRYTDALRLPIPLMGAMCCVKNLWMLLAQKGCAATLDRYHPGFTIDIYHPRRDHPDVACLNAKRDMRRDADYPKILLKNQLD